MGYQRSVWRSLGGGGGGAVVRCSCSEEEVRISIRSVGEERLLRRVLTRRWFESPRLSVCSNERAPSATPSDSSEPRPLSLISTLSSGSGSSRDENPAPPPSDQTPALNLDLSSEGGPDRKGRSHCIANDKEPFVMAPQLTYLDRVVMEIIETERMYVRDLRMIVEDYLAHIIDQCDLSIRPEQVCALFGNIEDIYEFNSELLQALDLCDNDPVAVARCFVMKSEYFEIYTQYCTNYPNSVAALTECMRNKSLAKFFRERQALLKRSLPLGSYLLKPVQRILKYHLLLQEIAKHFDPMEEGYEVVEDAIYTMTGVAWYINDMKRKHEHAVRLQEVQSLLLNWKGPDLTTYGELVLEGTFKVHRAKNERTLFLFDHMLLITKRRGEHFVYKTHISCSTLMLIESAKDTLSFSVIHYKHPKQPHTVQAKTVEERKLWAHHIKRTILENHQAIIPQKAKDAILEMNPTYPPRYRYSPERLKKASSVQSDEFQRDGRYGRRQSEPDKLTVKSSKDLKATLKQSHSEAGSPGAGRSTQPLNPEEEEEEICSRRDSVEGLICSDEEEGGRLSPQRSHRVEDSELDDLLEDEQPQEAEGGSVSADSCDKENVRLPKEDEEEEEEEEEGRDQDTHEQASSENTSKEKTSKQTTVHEPEPPCDSDSLSSTPAGTSVSPQRSQVKPERAAEHVERQSSATPDSDSKTLSSAESSEDEEDEKAATEKEGEATSILPSSVLDKASAIAQHFTNSIKRGGLAQDDARSLGCASPRLLSRTSSSLSLCPEPSDRTLRLNSACSDPPETFGSTDLTLLSPRDDALFDADRSIRRRRDSALSKQDQLLIGKIRSYYETAENQGATFSLQRRESLTYIPMGVVRNSVSRFNSNQNDESVQTNPSAKSLRLESNSALPTGTWADIVTDDCLDPLKSDMVNKEPEDSGESTRTRSQSVQDNPCEEEEFRPSSEMIKIWQTMEQEINRSEDRGCDRSREAQRKSRATHDNLSETPKTQNKICDRDSGASDLSTITEESTSPSPLKHKVPGVNHTGNLKDSLRTFREEAAIFRAPVPRVAQLRAEVEGERPGKDLDQLDETDKTNSKVLHLARQYSQRLKTTTPVVRQRSQGLLIGKKSLPCVLEEKENAGTVTSCLPKGKPNLTLPLVSHSQASSLPLSPVDQIQSPSPGLTCSSVGSSRVVSPGRARSHSPPSPTPPTENFNWPDVRELRSKYSNPARPQKSTVSRSRSIPEKMSDGGLRRHSSCSSSLPRMDEASCEVPSHKPCGSWDAGREERTKRLLRANSLDPRLSAEQMTELQKLKDQVANDNDDGYYIAAEAVLPNDPEHKIIVMEKLPDLESEPESEPESETAKKESKKEAEEEDDSYIQIRSPTSREKISIMAVIDRCRAYQESDEYKQREEVRAKTEPTRPQELDISVASTKDQDVESQKTSSNSGLKVEAGQQSIVKNLRDKFQNLS
uniref:Pleckstrin homology domain-containing family G member 3-like n=1 Tax=Labrus bergylta TaxID=56723 RepID=A0A3Q3G3F3_9LABR|nr:pleckstrin homology domain-containing family G member 3-like isoform X2 [Labrus bergylta]